MTLMLPLCDTYVDWYFKKAYMSRVITKSVFCNIMSTDNKKQKDSCIGLPDNNGMEIAMI